MPRSFPGGYDSGDRFLQCDPVVLVQVHRSVLGWFNRARAHVHPAQCIFHSAASVAFCAVARQLVHWNRFAENGWERL